MFVVNAIIFLLTCIFLFLNPGLIIIKAANLKKIEWEDIPLAFVFGLSLYNLIALLSHQLKATHLSLIWVIIANLILIKQKLPCLKNQIWKRQTLIFLIILGVFGQLLVIAPSGIKNKYGDIVFYSSNGHDGSWHIALMNEIQNEFPPQNPSYSGEKVKNYHFLSDIAASDINLFFKIPKTDLYFRFLPFIYSLSLGTLAYFIGKRISKSKKGGLWSVFFTYFAGSFGYILTLIKEGKIGGESIFWSSQIQSLSGNPPQALALIIILATLISLEKYERDKKKIWIATITTMISSLVLTKIYAWLVMVSSLVILSLHEILNNKKYTILITTILTGLASFALYYLNVSNPLESSSFLIFKPWWYIRTMIVEPSRLNLIDWELKRQTYLYERNILRVAQIEIQSFLIFIVGNLGTRIIAIYWFIKEGKKIFLKSTQIILTSIVLVSLVFPLFFIQKGVAGNTIQTFQYALLILGILAGISIAKIIKNIEKKALQFVISALVVIFSIPTQAALVYEFYSRPPLAKITKGETEALEFLKNNTPKESIIISPPYNQYSKFKDQITPEIWAWFDTSYIAAFSERKVFFADYEQMDLMGYSINQRRIIQEEIFSKSIKEDEFVNLLTENKIDYLYVPKKLKEEIDIPSELLNKAFENEAVEIWQKKD